MCDSKLKTRATGIRIPLLLYELVKACNPDRTFSEIVKCALEDTHCFYSKFYHYDLSDIEKEIDNMVSR